MESLGGKKEKRRIVIGVVELGHTRSSGGIQGKVNNDVDKQNKH